MRLDANQLRRTAAESGFQVEAFEKVLRLIDLLDALFSHPFLGERLVLKGGTALNLFVLDLPRLSVDIDLNYIGTVDRIGLIMLPASTAPSAPPLASSWISTSSCERRSGPRSGRIRRSSLGCRHVAFQCSTYTNLWAASCRPCLAAPLAGTFLTQPGSWRGKTSTQLRSAWPLWSMVQ